MEPCAFFIYTARILNDIVCDCASQDVFNIDYQLYLNLFRYSMKLLTDSISVCVIYIKNNIINSNSTRIIVKAHMHSVFSL
jgi:hypothetical protein